METNRAEANRLMTKDEIAIFVMINEIEKNKVDLLFNDMQKQAGGWVLKAIKKRFNVYGIQVDKKTMIMTLAMGDGVVGRCAKYVDDMVHWCKENMINEIDFDTFTTKIYPTGFPNF